LINVVWFQIILCKTAADHINFLFIYTEVTQNLNIIRLKL